MNIPTLVQVKGKEVKIHYDSEVSCEVRNLLIQRLREGVSLGKASKKTWIFYGQPDRKGGISPLDLRQQAGYVTVCDLRIIMCW